MVEDNVLSWCDCVKDEQPAAPIHTDMWEFLEVEVGEHN
jgi:hypothetical protein